MQQTKVMVEELIQTNEQIRAHLAVVIQGDKALVEKKALSDKEVATKKVILKNWNYANCEEDFFMELLKLRKEILVTHANLVNEGNYEMALAVTNHLYFDLYLDLLQCTADFKL